MHTLSDIGFKRPKQDSTLYLTRGIGNEIYFSVTSTILLLFGCK